MLFEIVSARGGDWKPADKNMSTLKLLIFMKTNFSASAKLNTSEI